MTRPLEREMGHHRKGVLLASALLLLAGCAREPSEADIKKAYDVKLSEINQSMAGAVLKPRLHSLKKLGCSKADSNPGYNCDVEVDGENIHGR